MTSHGRRRRRTDDSRRRKVILIAGAAVGVAAVAGVVLVSCSGSGGGGEPAATASAASSAGGSGKSGGSADGGGSGKSGGSSTTTAAAPAKYAKLPSPCKAVTAGTVAGLVPKARHSAGTPTSGGDPDTRGTCSWTGNGKDGYQYRWLSVSLQRFADDPRLGSAEDQARKRYTEQLQELSAVKGFTASPLTGFGDQANQVTGTQTLAKITSQNDTLLARTGNVVVLVEYNGAGLEGKKNPSAGAVQTGAQQAAKDALAAVAAANSNS
ncbi:DUF3558 domain-containing protein [Streptomyces sp. HPF1205]|uniref:DUF3558 domain-containing protein n=1 Tax=Streptomyces sp. HPF1205 TaxID=2873262 RepID=UPI001CED38F0|nr:DUF3558 domain-containing protein [Streptomyces sp. HPF1205]